MFEAVGAYHAGKLDEAGVADYTENACPTCGSCSGMYTANSMNCLTEAIGMALRGNGTIPAVWSARLRWPSRPVCRSWSWWSGISAPGTS